MKSIKILLSIILGIFFIASISAMSVYADFSDSTQSKTINRGQSITFNVDFFSMNPPMTIKVQLYQGNNLIHTFLNTNINGRIYYNTYTYTANTAGTFEIRVTGTDKINTDSEYLTLFVISPSQNNPPVLAPIGDKTVNENQLLQFTISATDPDSDTLTFSTSTLPNGALFNQINPTLAQFSWTPSFSQDGSYSVTFSVSDGKGGTDSEEITITVFNVPSGNNPPVIEHIPDQSIIEGNYYAYQVDAEDIDGYITNYNLLETHGWLNINPNAGLITGTAPLVSSSTNYIIEVEVTDNEGAITTDTYTLRVKNYVSGGTSKVISDSDIYYQNKYYDQFETGGVIYTEKPISKNINLWVLFYIIFAIIGLGIILVVYLLFRNIRR